MRYYALFFLMFVFTSSNFLHSIEYPVSKVENVQPSVVVAQKVTHILNSLVEEGWESFNYTAFILEDGSLWAVIKEEITSNNAFPMVNDTVKSTNGSTFYNLSRGGIFFAESLGTMINNPLKIEQHYSISTDLALEEFGWKSAADVEILDDAITSYFYEVRFIQLSNNLVYGVEIPGAEFDEWTSDDSVLMARSQLDQEEGVKEYLISLERGEIRDAYPAIYESVTANEINLDHTHLSFDGLTGNWQLDSSQLVILANWSEGDRVRLLQHAINFDELDQDELDEVQYICTYFLRDDIEINLEGWSLTFGMALNQDKGEAIFCWTWSKNDEMVPQCFYREPASVRYFNLLKSLRKYLW
ncbi:MAG: hypothetical protein K940chlam3_01708 [Chlamydiae bacterium]|nr:hypothetical protein [Chlamydiota bacterium]